MANADIQAEAALILEALEVREGARAWEPTTPERAALFQRLRAEFPVTPADGIMETP